MTSLPEEKKTETASEPSMTHQANNDTTSPPTTTTDLKTDNQKSMELLYNWYQSYYLWSMTNSLQNFSMMYPTSPVVYSTIHPGPSLHHHHHSLLNQAAAFPAPPPVRTNQFESINTLPRGYKIPTLMKRFMAEVLDFVYIQLLKVVIVVLLLNYTELIDEDSFNIIDMIEKVLTEDDVNNFKLPVELLLLEVVYVFISVLFESYCIYTRGYTPGKYFFNLRVVSCVYVVSTGERGTHVIPGTRLPLRAIFLRTFLKNFSIVFLFPTILFFVMPALGEHGQTSYDKVAESIVVEIRQ